MSGWDLALFGAGIFLGLIGGCGWGYSAGLLRHLKNGGQGNDKEQE